MVIAGEAGPQQRPQPALHQRYRHVSAHADARKPEIMVLLSDITTSSSRLPRQQLALQAV